MTLNKPLRLASARAWQKLGRNRCASTAAYPLSHRVSSSRRVTINVERDQGECFTIYIVVNVPCHHINSTSISCTHRSDVLRYISSTGAFTPPITRSGKTARSRLNNLSNRCPTSRSRQHNFRHFRSCRIILVRWQRNCSQNTDNRNNDHQFDQSETLLNFFHNNLQIILGTSVTPITENHFCAQGDMQRACQKAGKL